MNKTFTPADLLNGYFTKTTTNTTTGKYWFAGLGFLMLMMTGMRGWGQITEGFETGLPGSYNSTLTNATLGSGTWQIKDVISGTTGVNSGTTSAQIRNATAAQVISPTIAGGVGTIRFYVTASSISGAYQVNISTDGGTTFTPATGSPFTISTTKTLRAITVNNSAVNKIQFYRTGAAIYIDDFSTTTFAATTPSLAITGTTSHGSFCPTVSGSPISYTITNTGAVAAAGVTVVSSNAQFVVSALSSTTIAATGGTATYNVTFTPTSSGAKTATITVASTTTGSNSPTSSLTGTGTTAVAAAVTTIAATSLNSSGGTVNGNVTTLGVCPASTEKGFVYSATVTNSDPLNGGTGVTTIPVGSISVGTFSQALTGLPSTTGYTYKAYVFNGTVYTYGAVQTFTTSGALAISGTLAHGTVCPTLSTSPITYTITNSGSVTANGITVVSTDPQFVVSGLSGTSIAAGGTATYQVTFTPSSAGAKTSTVTVSSTTGGIASVNNTVTGTGTTPVTAVVTSSAATAIGITVATLNGGVTTVGVCPASTQKGFVYSTTAANSDPLNGGTGVTTVVVGTISTGAFSQALTSLPNTTGYTFKAFVFDGTSYTYGVALSFTTNTPIANDECAGAIALTLNAAATGGSVTGATQSLPAILCSAVTGNADDDVWYSFTTTVAGNYTIKATGGSGFDMVIDLRSGACNGANIDCADATASGSESITTSLAASTTYYIRLYSYAGSVPGTPTFTVAITAPLPPPVAAAAITLTNVSFTANWSEVSGATGYLLDVSNASPISSGSPILSESFDGTTFAPTGWTASGWARSIINGDINSGAGAAVANSNNGSLTTPVIANPGSMTFYLGRSGNTTAKALLIEVSTTSQNTGFTTVATYDHSNVPSASYDQYTLNLSAYTSSATVYIRFTKASSTTAPWRLDDIVVSSASNLISGYNPLVVVGGSTTSANVTGLTANTVYYYQMKATGTALTSINSNTITATTCSNPPTVGAITPPTCTTNTGSIVLSGLPSGNWTITRTPGNVVTTGSTTSATISGLPANATYTFTVATTTGCTSTASNNVVIPAVPTNTWNGTDGNFNDATKWSCLIAPTATQTLIINTGNVTMTANFDVQGSLTLGGTGTLTVNPDVTLSVTGGTLATGTNSLTFKSAINGSGSLGKVTAGGTVTGSNVTVERYIPDNFFRSWRLLSVPTSGSQTIRNSWQDGGSSTITSSGYGTQITGPVAGGGLDAVSPVASILSWNGTGFVGIANTNASIAGNKSYFLYIRGERTQGITGAITSSSATTLRTNGTVYTGLQTFPVGSGNQFGLIANLYPSAIDLNSIGATGFTPRYYYIWDSKLQSGNSLGVYKTIDADGGFSVTGPSGGSYSGTNRIIESGQSFFVQTNNAVGTVTINEDAKIAGSINGFLGLRPSTPVAAVAKLRSTLISINGSGSVADENVVKFDNAYPNTVDKYDALKFSNAGENFGILRDSKTLVIEGRQPVSVADTIYYRMWNMQPHAYQFQFEPTNLSGSGLTSVLEDKYLQKSTIVDLNMINSVNFTVDGNAGSSAADRFKIVFKQLAPLPVSILSISANRTSAGVKVSWKVAAERAIRSYEIVRSIDGRSFTAAGTVTATGNSAAELSYSLLDATAPATTIFYKVKSIGNNGEIKFSSIVKVPGGKVKAAISISPNPVEGAVVNLQLKNQPEGKYSVRILTNIGQVIMSNKLQHAGGNSTQLLTLPTGIAKGTYQLEVTLPDNSRQVQTLFINSNK